MAEKHKDCKLEPGSDDCFSNELPICNECPWWEAEMIGMVEDWSGDYGWED